MGRTLTNQVASPFSFNLPGGEFDILWNTPDGQKPTTGVFASWTGRADDLLIQRISFEPLFHRLILENRSTNGVYMIGSTATNMTGPSTLTTYLLDVTDLGLCDVKTNVLQRVLLTRDESFVWDGLNWRDDLQGQDPNDLLAQDFADLAAQFIAAGTPGTAQQGAAPQGAVVGMFNFMLVYSLWANQCPHFPTYSAPNNLEVPEYQLMLDVGANGQSSFMNDFTGPNGLLK